jgi:hypothetical protein
MAPLEFNNDDELINRIGLARNLQSGCGIAGRRSALSGEDPAESGRRILFALIRGPKSKQQETPPKRAAFFVSVSKRDKSSRFAIRACHQIGGSQADI